MNKNTQETTPPTIKKTISKIQPVSPKQQEIINENIARWKKENASRLAFEYDLNKEIASLKKEASELIRKLIQVEKKDPKEPILLASADNYDDEKDTTINYQEYN